MFEGKLRGTKVNLEQKEGTAQHCFITTKGKIKEQKKLFKFKMERYGIHQALIIWWGNEVILPLDHFSPVVFVWTYPIKISYKFDGKKNIPGQNKISMVRHDLKVP